MNNKKQEANVICRKAKYGATIICPSCVVYNDMGNCKLFQNNFFCDFNVMSPAIRVCRSSSSMLLVVHPVPDSLNGFVGGLAEGAVAAAGAGEEAPQALAEGGVLRRRIKVIEV